MNTEGITHEQARLYCKGMMPDGTKGTVLTSEARKACLLIGLNPETLMSKSRDDIQFESKPGTSPQVIDIRTYHHE